MRVVQRARTRVCSPKAEKEGVAESENRRACKTRAARLRNSRGGEGRRGYGRRGGVGVGRGRGGGGGHLLPFPHCCHCQEEADGEEDRQERDQDPVVLVVAAAAAGGRVFGRICGRFFTERDREKDPPPAAAAAATAAAAAAAGVGVVFVFGVVRIFRAHATELGEVRGLDLEVWGCGSRVYGFGCRLSLGRTLRKVYPALSTVPLLTISTQAWSTSSKKAPAPGCRVQGSGCRVQGSGCRVQRPG